MATEATWQPHEKPGNLTKQGGLPGTVFAFPAQRKEPLTEPGMCATRSPGSTR
jgi:hypothetical protein